MRWAALIAIAVGCGSAAGACAQSAATAARQLKDAAFATHTDGAVAWQSGEVRLSPDRDQTSVVSLRIKVGEALRPPVGPLLTPEHKEFDVTVVRSWPKAVSFEAEAFDLAIAPHAGLGVSNRGGQAEGGAMITVSPKSRGEQAMQRLRDMGVKDGASFGDAGLNMTHDEHGWDRAGWSTDTTSGLVGDAQVGVGWRKGDGQASFGVIHREVKGRHMIFGQMTRDDTMAAVSFSIRPGR
jgi:hypothetical protein